MQQPVTTICKNLVGGRQDRCFVPHFFQSFWMRYGAAEKTMGRRLECHAYPRWAAGRFTLQNAPRRKPSGAALRGVLQEAHPFVPGHEWSGEVVETGANVTGFAIGDAVVGECSIGCRKCKRCRSGNYHLCKDRSETGILKQQGGMAEYIRYPQFFLHKIGDLPYFDIAATRPFPSLRPCVIVSTQRFGGMQG